MTAHTNPKRQRGMPHTSPMRKRGVHASPKRKRGVSWTATATAIGLIALFGVAAAQYVILARHLSAARDARRREDYVAAERYLSNCWPLPGYLSAIALERDLSGAQQGDLSDEATWQARAKTPNDESVLILEALAKGSAATFRWNEARTYADAILERQPDHAQSLWLRGRAWIKLQQEEKAERDLVRAARLDPESGLIRRSLAEALHREGFVRAALAEYASLAQTKTVDSQIVLGLAHCYEEENQLAAAREVLEELLQQQPKLVAALVERSRVALRLAQPAEAEQFVRRALELCPDHTDANSVLRLCLEAQGKTDAALERRIGDSEIQQAALRKRLRDSPHDPAVICDIGRRMAQLGQPEESAGWFHLALREDPKYAPAHAALADYFENCGQHWRAAAHRQLAGRKESAGQANEQLPSSAARPINLSHHPILPSDTAEATEEEVHRLCAACHAYPPPDSMPRGVWRKEVKLGFDFLRESKLSGDYPSLESVVRYYESRASERLPLIEQPQAASKSPVAFDRMGTGWFPNTPPLPAVANLEVADLFDDGKPVLLACDTRINHLIMQRPYESSPAWQPLAPVTVPSHASVTDLDGDGRRDVLVASLGEFFPTDDRIGSVVWLRQVEGHRFEPVTLLDGIGRVADVEAADFNGDGRLDLVVAVFGWRKTGEILYLENQTTDWSKPSFVTHQIDPRHGAIHVPIVDLNRDGRPDFVALISQEHETVVAFLNEGDGHFRSETLFAAPHPSYGSSGIQLVDLDGDGDDDVLLTNGDVLDRPYLLKPYHGVAWLENAGRYPFTHHRLLSLYGASRAVAADFDGDGDQDIAAVSFLPRLEFPERLKLQLPSFVLLEQTSRGAFTPHVQETGTCDHFTCAAADFTGDGRPDLAIGNFSWKRSEAFQDAAVLWKNMGPPAATR
jgi:tetratricopeptide (TPR) repeat protein